MESADLRDYIFARGMKRERATVNRFFAIRRSPLGSEFMQPLGWSLPFVWLGLRLPHERLLRGYHRPPKKFKGDVDILGGGLEAASLEDYERCKDILQEESKRVEATLPEKYRDDVIPPPAHFYISMLVVESGKIKWPPNLSYIAAAEVKAAYYNAKGDLKHKESEYSGRDQADELCDMGFDRVGLVRFVVTEPVDSGEINPWTDGCTSKRPSHGRVFEPP